MTDYVQVRLEDVRVLLDMLKFDIRNYKKQYSADTECAAYDRLSAALSAEPVQVDANDHTMSGALVFAGTRMPVSMVANRLRDGAPGAEIKEAWPHVTDDQIEGVRRFIEMFEPQAAEPVAGLEAPQDRLSRDKDIILQAINEYDAWLLDDDYDAASCLKTIMGRMKDRFSLSPLPVSGEKLRENDIKAEERGQYAAVMINGIEVVHVENMREAVYTVNALRQALKDTGQ